MTTSRYTLNVYDDDFEIIKTLEAPGLRWGKLVEIMEKATDDTEDQTGMVEDIMLMIFPSATREDLQGCVIEDMFAVFGQIMNLAKGGGLVAVPGGKGKGAAKAKNR